MLKDQELISIYNQCRLSLESFGSYKKNIKISCGLKSREMLARGLPLIAGNHVDLFMERDFPYFQNFLTMILLLIFKRLQIFMIAFILLKVKKLSYKKSSFAENHVDIEAGMKTVIEYIKCGQTEVIMKICHICSYFDNILFLIYLKHCKNKKQMEEFTILRLMDIHQQMLIIHMLI